MAVIRDTVESQYFIQDKEGNVWGEIKPIDITMEHSSGEYPKIELSGYLSFDVDKVKEINKTKIKTTEITVDTLSAIPGMMSYAEWEKHKEELENKKGEMGMEILEIYERRNKDRLFAEMKMAKEQIIKADEITIKVAEFKEKLEEEYKMYVGVDLAIGGLTKESEEKIAKIETEHDLELEGLRNMISEIKAQLKICETYEQKIAVLIAYEIIDKKTKQILA